MTPFWINRPFTHDEEHLYRLTLEAHAASALRGNMSTAAAINAFQGSGSLSNAIASAILTIGDKHGPVAQTKSFITHSTPAILIQHYISEGLLIPGWGNSFHDKDPLWHDVEKLQRDLMPEQWKQADFITNVLHDLGKMIYPNPALYTAFTAIYLAMPDELAPLLFIQGRLQSWAAICTGFLKVKQ